MLYTVVTELINSLIAQQEKPSHQESRLQLDVKESMTNLQGVIDENAVQDHKQANLLSPTAPVCVEFLFEPEMNQTLPPLLTEEEVLRANLPSGEGHDADHPLTKCFAIITETLDFFQHFSSTGLHIEENLLQRILLTPLFPLTLLTPQAP